MASSLVVEGRDAVSRQLLWEEEEDEEDDDDGAAFDRLLRLSIDSDGGPLPSPMGGGLGDDVEIEGAVCGRLAAMPLMITVPNDGDGLGAVWNLVSPCSAPASSPATSPTTILGTRSSAWDELASAPADAADADVMDELVEPLMEPEAMMMTLTGGGDRDVAMDKVAGKTKVIEGELEAPSEQIRHNDDARDTDEEDDEEEEIEVFNAETMRHLPAMHPAPAIVNCSMPRDDNDDDHDDRLDDVDVTSTSSSSHGIDDDDAHAPSAPSPSRPSVMRLRAATSWGRIKARAYSGPSSSSTSTAGTVHRAYEAFRARTLSATATLLHATPTDPAGEFVDDGDFSSDDEDYHGDRDVPSVTMTPPRRRLGSRGFPSAARLSVLKLPVTVAAAGLKRFRSSSGGTTASEDSEAQCLSVLHIEAPPTSTSSTCSTSSSGSSSSSSASSSVAVQHVQELKLKAAVCASRAASLLNAASLEAARKLKARAFHGAEANGGGVHVPATTLDTDESRGD